MPAVVVVLPCFKMADWFGSIDTQIVFIVVHVAFGLPFAVQKTIDLYDVLWVSLGAGAVIQLLPMIAVVFPLQRHIACGLALGAVK